MIKEGKVDCTPDEAGYSPECIETLDRHCLDLIQKGTIQAASYALARKGKVFAHKSMGRLTSKSKEDDFMPDSMRPIASTTKAFVGISIMQLAERGRLFLTQPVASILKEFATHMHESINIFHLLTHTSGIVSDAGTYNEPYPRPFVRDWSAEEWISKIIEGPLHFKPGTRWAYCSGGYILLSEIVKRITGLDVDEYITKNILEPLGMNRSFFFVPDDLKHDVCIVSDWNQWAVNKKKSDVEIRSRLGGGGLISTVYDLSKMGRMLVAGGSFDGTRILGRKMVEAATRAQAKDFPTTNWRGHMFDDVYKVSWGFGFEVNKFSFASPAMFGHDGAEGALFYMDPDEEFVFAGFFPSEEWHGESWISPVAIAWSGIK